MEALFVLACIAIMAATLAVMAWSPAPCGRWCHAKGVLRLGVFAGAAFAAGDPVKSPALLVLLWSLAGVYALQAKLEADRQRRDRAKKA